MHESQLEFAAAPTSSDDGRRGRDHARPSRWWYLGECVVVVLLAATIWFGGGGQVWYAIVAFAATAAAAGVVAIVRMFIEPLQWSSVFRTAFTPGIVVVAFVFRVPITEAVFEVRFRAAEPALTAAAQAAVADAEAPMPGPAGGWVFTDRMQFSNGVVFFADGVGPLILKSCGFAYLPEGTTQLEPIRGDWYWLCV